MKIRSPLIAGLAFGSFLSPANAEIIDCEFEHGVRVEVQYEFDKEYSRLDDDAVIRVSAYPKVWGDQFGVEGQLAAFNDVGAEVVHEDFRFVTILPEDSKGDVVVWIEADEVAGTHTITIGQTIKEYEQPYADGATIFNSTHWSFEAEGKCLPRAE